MKYEILYKDAFPLVKCEMQRGEKIKAESDAMVAMSATLEISGSMNGGLLGGLARRMLTGESFFFQTIDAARGDGSVLLGHPAPGGIIDVEGALYADKVALFCDKCGKATRMSYKVEDDKKIRVCAKCGENL